MEKKGRLFELDILRGIAFILVVIQHTLGGYSFSKDISIQNLLISRFIYVIGESAVPIFLALTAIVLLYTYYDKFNVKEFYIKKLQYIVIPYIVCSFLNIILLHKEKLNDFAAQLVTGNSSYQLWYMALIIRLYLSFPLILFFTRKINKMNFLLKLSFLILYIIGYYFILKNNNYISNYIGKLIFRTPTELQQKFIDVTPLFWSLYFVIGAYIILSYNNFKIIIIRYKKSIFFVYTVVLSYYFYIETNDVFKNSIIFTEFNIIIHIIFNVMSLIIFFILSIYVETNTKFFSKYFKFIGKYSFPSYMLHIILLQELVFYIPQTKHIYSPITLLLMTISLSPFICYIINLLPYSEYILGVKSKKPLIYTKISSEIERYFNTFF